MAQRTRSVSRFGVILGVGALGAALGVACGPATGSIDDPNVDLTGPSGGGPSTGGPGGDEGLDAGKPGAPGVDSGAPTPGVDSGPGTPGVKDTGSSGTPDSSAPPVDTGSPGAPDTSAPPGPDTAPPPADTDPGPTGLDLAKDLPITEVALFQGVKVTLETGGAKASHLAPVIVGRPGLLRVYVTPGSGWSGGTVTGVLTLTSGGASKVVTATASISGASSDGALSSTINFDLDASAIARDTRYSVALKTTPGASSGDSSRAVYPASGADTLDAHDTGSTLKIKLVPVRYNADGSGRLPDSSASQIAVFKKWMYGIYPAQNVDITVRAPFDYSSAIDASGSGWSEILQAITNLRSSDGAPSDVYYFGIFAPADSFASFCGGGCVVGLSGLIGDPSDTVGRASVGIGFSGDESGETMAHEVGHAHGRSHAPCGGASGTDPSYPYSGAGIGSWGYDIGTKKLYDPSGFTDLMGYCNPVWISDYGFNMLSSRMEYVASHPMIHYAPGAPTKWRFVTVRPDGTLSWGDEITLATPPLAEPHTVTFEGADGKPLGTVTGAYYPYDDIKGGHMLVPVPAFDFTSIHVTDLSAAAQTRLARTF